MFFNLKPKSLKWFTSASENSVTGVNLSSTNISANSWIPGPAPSHASPTSIHGRSIPPTQVWLQLSRKKQAPSTL